MYRIKLNVVKHMREGFLIGMNIEDSIRFVDTAAAFDWLRGVAKNCTAYTITTYSFEAI